MTPFRLALASILVVFAGISFLYAIRIQERLLEQQGYLWNARRESFRLDSRIGGIERERDFLADRVAALRTELSGTEARLAVLERRIVERERELVEARVESESLRARNGELAAAQERMTAEVFRLVVAAHGERWLDGMRRAGAFLAEVVEHAGVPAGPLLGADLVAMDLSRDRAASPARDAPDAGTGAPGVASPERGTAGKSVSAGALGAVILPATLDNLLRYHATILEVTVSLARRVAEGASLRPGVLF